MKKLLMLTLVVLLGWAAGSVAQDEAPEAGGDAALLGAMDGQRFSAFFSPEVPSSTFTVEIIADRPDGSKQATVRVSFKFSEDGSGGARIDYLTPEELAGDVFIIKGDDIFFWNPDLIEPLKVNGRFEVFGDATVAEVVGIAFSGEYTVTERQEYNVDQAADMIYSTSDEQRSLKLAAFEMVAAGTPLIELKLEATRESIAFPGAWVTANAETLQPITLELFDEDGDLLHFNTFESYDALEDGRTFFDRQLLDNRIVPVNKTLLIVSNIQNIDLPLEQFDPELLGAEEE